MNFSHTDASDLVVQIGLTLGIILTVLIASVAGVPAMLKVTCSRTFTTRQVRMMQVVGPLTMLVLLIYNCWYMFKELVLDPMRDNTKQITDSDKT